MDERELERMLHDRFAALPRSGPDPLFVERVMDTIESNNRVAIDARRPLIVGAALLFGAVALLYSLLSLDLYLVTSLQDLVTEFVRQVFSSPAPGWYWIVVLFPLFWTTLAES